MTKKLSLVLALSALTGFLACACDDDSDSNSTPITGCTNDAVQCSSAGVPQKCVNGQWTNQVACQNGQTCQKGACTGTPVDDKKCTNDKCKAKTGNDYSGDVCITEDTVYCGCTKNSECKTNYVCNLNSKLCEVYEACDAAKCAAKTGNDYAGNACVISGSDPQCGCNSSSDCNSGYTCSNKKCTKQGTSTECNPTTCSNKPEGEYKGNACVTKGTTKDCGCNLSSDCRDGYECNNNICTVIAGCNPSVCSKETGDSYRGNICVDADSGKRCGCDSDSDCNEGYSCDENNMCTQGSSSGCDPKACAAEVDYTGSACVSYDDGGKLYCGCKSDADCKSGFVCDTEMMECESEVACDEAACDAMTGEQYTGSACIESGFGGEMCGCDDGEDCKAGYTCNQDYGICTSGGGSSCDASECAKASEYYGSACIDDGFGGKTCGCSSASDCKSGMKCNSSGVCVDNGGGETKICSKLKLEFPSSFTAKKDNCSKYNELNELSDCKWAGTEGTTNHEYTLTYTCGAVVHIKPSSYSSGMANVKKPGTDYYITIENLASGVSANFVWQLGTTKYDTNQLKVSELNNPSTSQLFTATAQSADMNHAFTLSKSGNGLKFEHGGSATNVISIKSISIH
ncbi:MAG: hypothetical protein IJU23_14435 [Proteobacteria bacterium]|nr:hypothetical protein [Pseudomonadota bacterium]